MKKLFLVLTSLMLVTNAMAQDEKPSAYNAPVVKKMTSYQFTCTDNTNIHVHLADIKTIHLTTEQGYSTLTRDDKSTRKWVAVFHRPLENHHMDTYKNDTSSIKFNDQDAIYTHLNEDGQNISTHCSATMP